MKERIHDWNLRAGHVPLLLVKAFLAFVIAALVMALLVPFMHRRGVALEGWMVGTVVVASLAIGLGPGLWRQWRARKR